MIPPETKNLILSTVEKYVSHLRTFRNSNPVIMLGQLKLDRIDQKITKQASKLNTRQMNKDVKVQGSKKRYEKRKAAITYRSYTVDFKRKLIQKIREINQTSSAGLSKIIRSKARELSIHPKNIFRWFHTKQIKKKQGGRKALYPEMQERLAQFIINNPKMKRKHILRQAKQIMEDLQIPGREYFNFSKGWYERFRQRLVKRKIIPEKIEDVKQQNDGYDSDSDFDESEQSIKKEEFFQKLEFNNVKIQNFDQSSEQQDSVKLKIKAQCKEDNTNMNGNQFILFYEELFKEEQKDLKIQKKQSAIKTKKSEPKYPKEQLKTDQSGQNQSYELSTLNDYEKKKLQVSIFASSEQDAEKE